MGFISWILVGLVAGAIGSLVVPGRTPGGILGALVFGLIGAIIGGWLFSLFNLNASDSLIGQIIVAAIGAIIALLVFTNLVAPHSGY